MSDYRELGPVPDPYFSHLHNLMEGAGIGSLEFGISLPDTNEILDVSAQGPFFGGPIGTSIYEASQYEGMRIDDAIDRTNLKLKILQIAKTAMTLHPLIVENSPRAREYPHVQVAVKIDDICRSPVKNVIGWHTDGGKDDNDFVVVTACDNMGTLRRSRIPGLRAHMPVGVLVEFGPDFEHAEPITRSSIPITRTFTRHTYKRQAA